MCKLDIEYRTNDEGNYFRGNTYYYFSIEDKSTLISIAPNEDRKLKDIIFGVEEELQDGFRLQKDEKFKISEFDQVIMEQEEILQTRLDNKGYNFCKKCYYTVQCGQASYEEILENIRY